MEMHGIAKNNNTNELRGRKIENRRYEMNCIYVVHVVMYIKYYIQDIVLYIEQTMNKKKKKYKTRGIIQKFLP